jgi:hypothetical protein
MKTDLATLMTAVLLFYSSPVDSTSRLRHPSRRVTLAKPKPGDSRPQGYTVMDRHGNRTIGEIKALTVQNLLVKQFFSPAKTITVARPDSPRLSDD